MVITIRQVSCWLYRIIITIFIAEQPIFGTFSWKIKQGLSRYSWRAETIFTKLHSMQTSTPTIDSSGHTIFEERRKNGDRRESKERRSSEERRHDFRDGSNGPKRTIKIWLRSITKARLGVDRRKEERRNLSDRRQPHLQPLLTPEEIKDLLYQ